MTVIAREPSFRPRFFEKRTQTSSRQIPEVISLKNDIRATRKTKPNKANFALEASAISPIESTRRMAEAVQDHEPMTGPRNR
jgi:hypothetical protein